MFIIHKEHMCPSLKKPINPSCRWVFGVYLDSPPVFHGQCPETEIIANCYEVDTVQATAQSLFLDGYIRGNFVITILHARGIISRTKNFVSTSLVILITKMFFDLCLRSPLRIADVPAVCICVFFWQFYDGSDSA